VKNARKSRITVDKSLKNKSGPVGIFDEREFFPTGFEPEFEAIAGPPRGTGPPEAPVIS